MIIITFEPLKMGGLCIEMVVIPKHFMLYFCSTAWIKALKSALQFNLDYFIFNSVWWHTESKLWKYNQCPNIYYGLTVQILD